MIIYSQNNRPLDYYVYAYMREFDDEIAIKDTPYYIGKGKGNRAWRRGCPKDNRILILEQNLTETDAHTAERKYISEYGRKDKGTGILENKTDGGQGASGCVHTAERNAKRSKALTGRKLDAEHIAKRSATVKGRKQTPEHIESRVSQWRNKPQEQVTCPYCNKVGGIIVMRRYHFDNCKHRFGYIEQIKITKPREAPRKVTCIHCGKIGAISNMKRWHFDKCNQHPDNIDKPKKAKQQKVLICPHCNKVGVGGNMYSRHFDRCRHHPDYIKKPRKKRPPTTDETRAKLRAIHKGQKQELVLCPNCNVIGGKSVMKRHHFDNCKHRPK